MVTVCEGKSSFTFDDGWIASKYDDWTHYRRQLTDCAGGMKAVDIIAIAPRPKSCWLIEVKDYRRHQRTKPSDLAHEVAVKVRDTLAGLVSAKYRANEDVEKTIAGKALKCTEIRVVLHLGQPVKHSKLFPRAINPANVQDDLRQKLRGIEPRALVVEISNADQRIPWRIASFVGDEEPLDPQ